MDVDDDEDFPNLSADVYILIIFDRHSSLSSKQGHQLPPRRGQATLVSLLTLPTQFEE